MDIYHWPSPEGNFGDDLNTWLWDFLLPGYREIPSDDLLVGVGTVLDTALLPECRKKLVVGSGTGYGQTPSVDDRALWDIRCVRGPLTAGRLGIDVEKGILDPAVLIADMEEFQGLDTTLGTVFVPHWESALHGCWDEVCRHAGITYIDPCAEAHEVIARIAQSTLVIAESMHAAILADAFRVPWIAVTTSKQINAFKWRDWAGSLEMDYAPHVLPLSSPLEAGAKGAPYFGLRWPKMAGERSAQAPNLVSVPVDGEIAPHGENGKRGLKARVKALLSSRVVRRALMVPAVSALERCCKAEPMLSDEHVLARQKERFYEVLDGVKRDYGLGFSGALENAS